MNWLTMPWSALTGAEREWLHDAARQAAEKFGPACVIVNIGVEHGCSLHCLCAGAPRATVYGVDVDNSRLTGEPGAVLLTGDSNKLWRKFDREVHLLFVDGGHDHKVVRGDLAWLRFIVPGGIAAFHDYYDVHDGRAPWIQGVKKAVSGWAATADGWEAMDRLDSIQAFRRAG